MSVRQYDKLVRDRIPEIIAADGRRCECTVLGEAEYLEKLDEKLNEELAEYQQSKSLEELADLLEVIRAVIEARGSTVEAVEAIRAAKAEARGAFSRRILLKRVFVEGD